jgi:hypothetical protein
MGLKVFGFDETFFHEKVYGWPVSLWVVVWQVWGFSNLNAHWNLIEAEKGREPKFTDLDAKTLRERILGVFRQSVSGESWNVALLSTDASEGSEHLTATMEFKSALDLTYRVICHVKLQAGGTGPASRYAYWFDAAYPWVWAGRTGKVVRTTAKALDTALGGK